MTSGQRTVAIVALGASCWVIASAVNRWLDWRNADGGWFNYAPSKGVAFSPAGDQWRELLVWLAAIIVWFGVSYLMLRQTDDRQ